MASIAVRHLVKVLLVVVLSKEIGQVAGRCDVRCDVGIAACLYDCGVCIPRGLGELALFFSRVEDGAAVLSADVVALTEALRGIVIFPEDFQDVVAGDLGGSVGEEDGLRVTRPTSAHFFVCRIG